jgi:F0F1-type ATP synthase membrane subunit b/b'
MSLNWLNILIFMAIPQTAFAAGGGEETLTLPLINFAVFMAIVFYVYNRKVKPMLVERSVDVHEALNRVALNERKVMEELANLRESLATVEDEEESVIENFREEGVRSAEAIRQAMLDEVHRIEKETEQMKANLLNQLEAELRNQISKEAIKRAGEKLRQMLSPEMDANLRREVLRALQQ